MIEEKDIQNFITSLRKLSKSFNSEFPEEYEKVIKEYFEPIKIYNLTGTGSFPIIERITINKRVIKKNIRIEEISNLKYPPSEFVKSYGRANLKYQSVFYGTFDFMTAVKEMKPEIGDLITISRWTLKNINDYLNICPMFLKQPTDGSINLKLLNLYHQFIKDLNRFPSQISRLYLELHQFYSDCFAREVNHNQGYILTAILADKILNQYDNGIIDAIIYPSTKEDFRTENIVIKQESFDTKYRLSDTIEKRLLNFSPNGERYVFELLGQSLRIDGQKVIWK